MTNHPQHGTARHGTARHGTAQHNTAQHRPKEGEAKADLELRVVLEHEPGVQATPNAVLPLKPIPAHQNPHFGHQLLLFLINILLWVPISIYIALQANNQQSLD